jgi:hypothetical protein
MIRTISRTAGLNLRVAGDPNVGDLRPITAPASLLPGLPAEPNDQENWRRR